MENWVDITGYEGLYMVSDAGNVRGRRGWNIGYIGNRGYVDVHLVGKDGQVGKSTVHRLVAKEFLDKSQENCSHIHHINGDKSDNRAENLVWVTSLEHAALHPPTRNIGENNGQAKLTSDMVTEARNLYAGGNVSQRLLAQRYGVSRVTIGLAIRRKTWKHV